MSLILFLMVSDDAISIASAEDFVNFAMNF